MTWGQPVASSSSALTAATRPSRIPMSRISEGAPVPSNQRPCRMIVSNVMPLLLGVVIWDILKNSSTSAPARQWSVAVHRSDLRMNPVAREPGLLRSDAVWRACALSMEAQRMAGELRDRLLAATAEIIDDAGVSPFASGKFRASAANPPATMTCPAIFDQPPSPRLRCLRVLRKSSMNPMMPRPTMR